MQHRCPFDGHMSDSVQSNLEYMASRFSFFIPYIRDLVELDQLLQYLLCKVSRVSMCLSLFISINSCTTFSARSTFVSEPVRARVSLSVYLSLPVAEPVSEPVRARARESVRE